MKKYKSLSEYIKDLSPETLEKINSIRKTIKKAAPNSEESISYNMPTFKLKGKVLVHVSAFKNHIGFFPTPSGVSNFISELKGYKTSKGTIQFQYDKPIPYDLISKIVRFRVIENKKLSEV